jgi:hypothetical protein
VTIKNLSDQIASEANFAGNPSVSFSSSGPGEDVGAGGVFAMGIADSIPTEQ